MTRVYRNSTPVFESLLEELNVLTSSEGSCQMSASLSLAAILTAIPDSPASAYKSLKLADYAASEAAGSAEVETFSTDPDVIREELGLSPGLTRGELASLRRKFAVRNHPDRLPAKFLVVATQRMMIANTLCDCFSPIGTRDWTRRPDNSSIP